MKLKKSDNKKLSSFLTKAEELVAELATAKAKEAGVPCPEINIRRHGLVFFAEASSPENGEVYGRAPLCTAYACAPFESAKDIIRDSVDEVMMPHYVSRSLAAPIEEEDDLLQQR